MDAMMMAERFYAEGRRVVVEQVPIPQVGPGEVLLKVAYCGICHSDLSLLDGNFAPKLPVVTQGHEVSGYIAEIGEGVTGWEVGDRVIPSAGRPCLKCRNCRRGNFADCLSLELMAFAFDGGWAEYVKVNATGLTRIPDGVPMDQAAILADAVSTPFGAVVRSAQVHLGNAVAIWGLGGVGTHIVQLAKLAGAVPIIAIDINDESLERALQVGADFAFRSDDPELLAKITDATGGRMIDVAFDAVGIQATSRQAIETLDMNGKLVTVGMSAQRMELDTFANMSLGRKRVIGHLGYKVQDIGILAELVAYKRIDLSKSISAVVPLSEVQRGIDMLKNREGNPIRILVKPDPNEA